MKKPAKPLAKTAARTKRPAPNSTAQKLDLYKVHAADYAAPRKPVFLTLAPAQYLAIRGCGAPGGSEFSARIGALYAVAYTIKMTRKFAGLPDYTIGKLEAQYWSDAKGPCFASVPKEQWNWNLLIRTPEFVMEIDRQAAVAKLLEKNKPAEVSQVQLETLDEGPCVQMLHVGPYDKEGDTVGVMLEAAAARGVGFHGRHHEIYLSDPRRVEPERLKTILRLPVTPTAAPA